MYCTFVFLVTGCEFFRDFKDNEYNAEGLHFNWQQVRNKKVFGASFTLLQDDKLNSSQTYCTVGCLIQWTNSLVTITDCWTIWQIKLC